MFRSKGRRLRLAQAICASLALLLFASSGRAAASEKSIVLMLGDVETRPAVLALAALQGELRAAGVSVRIVRAGAPTPQDRAALRSADAALAAAVDTRALSGVADELAARRAARRETLALGVRAGNEALGLAYDAGLDAYFRAGGVQNYENLIRAVAHSRFGAQMRPAPVRETPERGLYDLATGEVRSSFEAYRDSYRAYRPEAPWAAVVFYRASLVSGQMQPLEAVARALEAKGFNVLPMFGYPYDGPLREYLLDADRRSRVEVVVALGMKVGATAETAEALAQVDAPVINAITLSHQSAAEWRASRVGIDVIERAWQLSGSELSGQIQPTVVAARERVRDPVTGLEYIEERAIDERVGRLADRAAAWVRLRRTANAEKRLALIYFNYPHGSETVGAAYLNVLPQSLWSLVGRLKADGYDLPPAPALASPEALQRDIQAFGVFPAKDGPALRAGLAQLARSGQAARLPLSEYRRWYDALPAQLRAAVETSWGPPERAPTLWRDETGAPQFVFPVRRFGQVLLAPQPTRAWEQNLEKLHDEVSLPPSHEYIAFYLWLQHGFAADAVVHIGTHGTQEWLAGREAGMGEDDPTEALIGAMPNIYPYVMDDVGEGVQAKRRGMAVIVDHMTPPFDQAGLNPDLRELAALLNDYRIARHKSPLLAESHLAALNALAAKTGVLKDLGVAKIVSEADLEHLEEFLDGVGDKLTPFGLHTFGVAPKPEQIEATAQAIASLDGRRSAEQQAARVAALSADIRRSADLELDGFARALAGRYIAPGPSADLLRNPAALPTGRNFYGLDPARIPSRETYATGARLAEGLIADYRARHGAAPEKLTLTLWGVETQRHEGVMEAQAMALMGVRPTWDERGRVTGVEAIPAAELGRPRVDVVMISSGLFRDLFPNVLKLLDQAAQLAQRQDDPGGNVLARNSAAAAAALRTSGVEVGQAERLASVRIYGLPSGAYGTNIEKLIPLTRAWRDEREIADVYVNRMSHPYGAGYWGGEGEGEGAAPPVPRALQRDLLRRALSGAQVALHSRSSHLFATLDNDDFFQYLGGAALAVRSVDGRSPELQVSDLSNPRRPRQVSLDRYMGEEMQARYLNPRWADRMLDEGYSGARFLNRVTDYLWAWQVTAPEVVDAAKWQGLYDTYVADRHGLKVRERFARAGALRSYQAITDRMLTAIERGYWSPDATVRARLQRENAQALAAAEPACGAQTCSRATRRLVPDLGQAPGPAVAPPKPAAAVGAVAPKPTPKASPAVSGFRMEEIVRKLSPAQRRAGGLAALIGAVVLIVVGVSRRRPKSGGL